MLFYVILVCLHFFIIFLLGHLLVNNKLILIIITKKGFELQQKICGLKRYIKDYSQLNQKNIIQMELWESYLIYAIIFDLKGKLNEDAKQLYQKLVDY